MKYSASPAVANSARPLERRNPNALRDELIRHLNEDATMSSFDFGLQFLDTDRMTYQGKRRDANFWIENAAVEWPEAQAPFHTVARLTLLPKSQLSAEACEAAYIDVTENSTADSAPVGGINRVRSYAVAASRNARLGRPQQVEDLGHARGHVTGIQDWLERHGLEKYAAVFAEHEITLEVLPDLTEADIDRLALPTGPRRRLMSAIEALGAATRAQRSIPVCRRTRGRPGQLSRRRAAPAHRDVLRPGGFHRAGGAPRPRGIARADAGLPQGVR